MRISPWKYRLSSTLNPTKSGFTCREKRHGFALVVALSLVSFIVLLVLVFSTLVQVELATTRQNQLKENARLNAQFGLYMALSELQSLAGHDQRVTASGELANATGKGTDRWTGVWQSRMEGGTAQDFLGWLVSLPEEWPVAAESDFNELNTVPEITLEAGRWRSVDEDWVVLVGEGSVNLVENPEHGVLAAKREVYDNKAEVSGYYAFWTGDESTKARVNLAYREEVLPPQNILTVPYAGYPMLDRIAFSDIIPGDRRLGQLTRLSELSLLGSDTHVAQQYYHDLTMVSRGLLTNTKRGGMRKDLSHIFDSDEAFEREFGAGWNSQYMFAPEGSPLDFAIGAPNWGIMRSFYNLHEQVNGSEIRPMAIGSSHGTNVTFAAYQTQGDAQNYQQSSAVNAVLSWIQLGIGLDYLSEVVEGGDGSEVRYYPRLHLRPVVGLYNPYDISLEASNYFIEWSIRPRIRIQVGDNQPVEFQVQEVIPLVGGGSFNTRFQWRLPNTEFRPGETRYFSLNGSHHLTSGAYDANMMADWDEFGSYYVHPSRDSHVVAATQRGSTSSLRPESATTPENQRRFGITSGEAQDLEITVADGDPFPEVEITVSYYPVDASGNPSSTPAGVAGNIWVKLHNSNTNAITQLVDSYFQEVEAKRPQNAGPFRFGIDQVGVTPNLSLIGFGLARSDNNLDPQRQYLDANVRAFQPSGRVDGVRWGKGRSLAEGWGAEGHDGSSMIADPPIADFERFTGFYGSSREITGSNQVVLFHVPREAPQSLGLFQHANMGRFSRHPSYMAGNSYAIPRIPLGEAWNSVPYTSQGGTPHYAYDWSYLINERIWDDYYFSTIPQDITNQDIVEYRNSQRLLGNPRLTLYETDDTSLEASSLTDSQAEKTAQLAAASQLIEGPFNVNSLSVSAWKTFLGSNSDLEIPVYDSVTGVSSPQSEAQAVFFRSPVTYNGAFETEGLDDTFWNGYRRLSDSELELLAEAVVEEVKKRGPFSSISDFVNRRLVGTEEEQKRGALQAALDSTINTRVSEDLVGTVSGDDLAIPDFAGGVFNQEDRPGSGAPGWILQADALQVLGPLLTVRGDTFVIRTYGDTRNPVTGEVEATAWCEALVQRLPRLTSWESDQSEEELLDALPSGGRSYRLLAFRWLSPEEI